MAKGTAFFVPLRSIEVVHLKEGASNIVHWFYIYWVEDYGIIY